MYNIHSHYENIFSLLKTLVKDPVVLYFFPFGATNYQNIEHLHCNGDGTSPVFLCYDQEPITDYVHTTFQKIREQYQYPRPVILLNTESNSITKKLLEVYKFSDCYYFFHIFAAADWYRGYQYHSGLIEPKKRKITKKYITFNRITGNSRAYRSLFVAKLHQKNLINKGHVSYSDTCPEHGHYSTTIFDLIEKHNVPYEVVNDAKLLLDQIKFPLRIDFKEENMIPNSSQILNAIPEMMESFLHVVTETCFWETKNHLTEKIFKPIVARQPFVLLGCANNLKYLKSYGFKTFDAWWDESYDAIQDPLLRLEAITNIIEDICRLPDEDLEGMLQGMQYVLDYNYNLFYSREFIDRAWNELEHNLKESIPPRLRLIY